MQREASRRDPGLQPIGPSGLRTPPDGSGELPQARVAPMSAARIEQVIAAYGEAAAGAARPGFDGVEIHMGHGYLIDPFFWSRTNLRADPYGGDPGRSRFAVEVVQEVRRSVGPAFPVFARISQFEMGDYAARLAESPSRLDAFLAPLVDAGIDVFDCSQRRFWEPEFDDSPLNLGGWVKRLTRRPVVTVGSVGLDRDFTATLAESSGVSLSRLHRLEQMVAEGEADLVAVGRALLSDAEWANKVRAGEADRIRPYSGESLLSLD